MRAVDRTTLRFMACLEDAIPGVRLTLSKSKNGAGRSNYVYIANGRHQFAIKVRISDHPVGRMRALYGREDFHIAAGEGPGKWAVWIGRLRRRLGVIDLDPPAAVGPLFEDVDAVATA